MMPEMESLTYFSKSFHNDDTAEANDLSPQDVIGLDSSYKRCLLLESLCTIL